MSAGEFDVRAKQLEGTLDKAESLLESAGQALRAVEKAGDRIGKGSRVPLVLLVAGTLAGAAVVLIVARRQV
jgi:ABC-type hemin transport system substrate-binding protein